MVTADRALIVDMLPLESQQVANLWISRATSLGALLGFFIGHLDLLSIPGLRALGGTQLQILSAIISIGLLFFHGLVALSVQEQHLVKMSVTTISITEAHDVILRDPKDTFIWSVKAVKSIVAEYTLKLPLRIQKIVSHFSMYSVINLPPSYSGGSSSCT